MENKEQQSFNQQRRTVFSKKDSVDINELNQSNLEIFGIDEQKEIIKEQRIQNDESNKPNVYKPRISVQHDLIRSNPLMIQGENISNAQSLSHQQQSLTSKKRNFKQLVNNNPIDQDSYYRNENEVLLEQRFKKLKLTYSQDARRIVDEDYQQQHIGMPSPFLRLEKEQEDQEDFLFQIRHNDNQHQQNNNFEDELLGENLLDSENKSSSFQGNRMIIDRNNIVENQSQSLSRRASSKRLQSLKSRGVYFNGNRDDSENESDDESSQQIGNHRYLQMQQTNQRNQPPVNQDLQNPQSNIANRTKKKKLSKLESRVLFHEKMRSNKYYQYLLESKPEIETYTIKQIQKEMKKRERVSFLMKCKIVELRFGEFRKMEPVRMSISKIATQLSIN